MSAQQTVTLNNDVQMPVVGFGTWTLTGGSGRSAIATALEAGYTHIDTASMYNNEELIGQVIRRQDIPREDLFITSKVWNNNHGYDSALRAFDASLRRLDTDYLDLYLIHWPRGGKLVETWQALEKVYSEGRARAIGVSNYAPSHLQQTLDAAEVVPAVNQIELHPWNLRRQEATLDACMEHNITVEAYTPLNKGRRLNDSTLTRIANAHGVTPARVILRWDVQRGFVTIPRSQNPDHIRANLDVFSFSLSDDEMQRINTLG